MLSLRLCPRRARPSSTIILAVRLYSTPASGKSNIKLVGELRKLTNAPISKARQALAESDGDVQAALKWLEKDISESGAAKAERVKSRVAKEGLLSLSVASPGISDTFGLIELNCESDFVARIEDFKRLAHNISRTVADNAAISQVSTFLPMEVPFILKLPMFESDRTVGASILDTIARVGENISLKRAITLAISPEVAEAGVITRVGAYMHGSIDERPQGKIAGVSLTTLRVPEISKYLENSAFLEEMGRLNKELARQVVGFNPIDVGDATSVDETHLYAQPFMMYGGPEASQPVRTVLEQWKTKWGLSTFDVNAFVRWQVGETL